MRPQQYIIYRMQSCAYLASSYHLIKQQCLLRSHIPLSFLLNMAHFFQSKFHFFHPFSLLSEVFYLFPLALLYDLDLKKGAHLFRKISLYRSLSHLFQNLLIYSFFFPTLFNFYVLVTEKSTPVFFSISALWARLAGQPKSDPTL